MKGSHSNFKGKHRILPTHTHTHTHTLIQDHGLEWQMIKKQPTLFLPLTDMFNSF